MLLAGTILGSIGVNGSMNPSYTLMNDIALIRYTTPSWMILLLSGILHSHEWHHSYQVHEWHRSYQVYYTLMNDIALIRYTTPSWMISLLSGILHPYEWHRSYQVYVILLSYLLMNWHCPYQVIVWSLGILIISNTFMNDITLMRYTYVRYS